MLKRSLFAIAIAIFAAAAKADDTPTSTIPSYPITLSASEVREFPAIAIDFGNLKVAGDSFTVVPISTELGVTGAVLIGNGTYTYAPEAGKTFAGRFHTAMLRFNTKDADSILKLDSGKKVVDKGASELAQLVVAGAFGHCYHRGKDALIPPEHAIAADLYSQELGNILISADDKIALVHNFTTRATLYEKK
ncbi:MAG TPA: hypothetical protein VGM76_02255 [Lacipirellulaceae bacterium]|jgi:hypothetical protein